VGQGEAQAAVPHLERAVALRPNLAAAWFYLGTARAELGRLLEATAAFERALAIDPTHTRAYLALARTLVARGERGEALRTLRHGATAAARPEEVAEELAKLPAGAPSEPGGESPP
jgi:Flp pilus assembly protein TadD